VAGIARVVGIERMVGFAMLNPTYGGVAGFARNDNARMVGFTVLGAALRFMEETIEQCTQGGAGDKGDQTPFEEL